MREWLKDFKEPVSRMVLPIWNHSKFDSIMVDEPGSCTNQHILCYGKMHRYQDAKGRLIAVMCPERLTYDQKTALVQDQPPGSWESKLADRKIQKLTQEAEKRRRAAEAEKTQWKGNQ
jgi:hypothetical protein